jgi:isoleucyl-tRNA synthetase
VHLALFPTETEILAGLPNREGLEKDWQGLLLVREAALKSLEEARQAKTIGSSLEAQLLLSLPESLLEIAKRHAGELRELFIVSGVKLEPAPGENGAASQIHVQVSPADGKKCERCWNYSVHVGENPRYPGVCERCSAALKEIEQA